MRLTNPNKMPREPAEAAAYWAMRLEAPNCRPADRAAFEAWRLQSKRNTRAFARVQRALRSVDRHLTSTAFIELGAQIFEQTRARKFWRERTLIGIAAVCGLVVGAALYWQNVQEPRVDAPQVAPAMAFETAIGERSTVTLSDNSTITLNTDSLVAVHFTERSDTRRLKLERGQAHFEVAKEARPFEVLAGNRRVIALGTTFDIRLDPDQQGVLVTLVEGRVLVEEVLAEAAGVSEPVGVTGENVSPTELEPGEQLVAKANETPAVIEADMERVAGWREGRLVFRDDALPDAVAEINRYSRSQLVINDDDHLEAIRISGVFDAGKTSSFIQAVEAIHPVKAHPVDFDRIELFWLGEGMTVAESDAPGGDVRETDAPPSKSDEGRIN